MNKPYPQDLWEAFLKRLDEEEPVYKRRAATLTDSRITKDGRMIAEARFQDVDKVFASIRSERRRCKHMVKAARKSLGDDMAVALDRCRGPV
jgi:hypothetical protein